MPTLYWLSVYLHIFSAVIWIGGMTFIILVVVPWLRKGGCQSMAGIFLRETGERFRRVGWMCLASLFVTGLINLRARGVTITSLASGAWWASAVGHLVACKALLFAAVLATSVFHDFFAGPRATAAIIADPASDMAAKLRRQSTLLGRVNAVLALLLLAVAVSIVRGTPF